METLFKIADASAHGILYFMGIMSVVSVAIMIERFFALKKIGSSSNEMAIGFRKAIEEQDISRIENMAKDAQSLEGKALGYGLNFVSRFGIAGLDELFNSFKIVERAYLEKNL